MDLGRIDALFQQRREGHTLPQGLYTDPDSFDFDMAAIYGQSWLMAGLECELPKAGSYLSMMVGKWPVIITRDRQGEIRAFHNSCRHRGSMICAVGSGTAPKLVCPYHRWTYDLDGSLFAANRMGDDFDKAEHGLKPVAIECVAGAIFICLSETPPPIDDFSAKLAEYAAPHNLKDAKLAYESVLVENANWKLVMENGRECYHCSTGHPELSKTFPVGMSKHFDSGEDARVMAFEEKMDAFRKRMTKYLKDRLEPNLPDWPVVCLYPMSKRRVPGQNWYALDFEARKKLMAGHARVGRTYSGRILQLITGSTGLDDDEWFVTLFSKTTSDIKAIVYEMRFDEVSAQYADFGEFFIGLQLPLDALYSRLGL